MEHQQRFDAAAATWDEEPRRVKLAGDLAQAVRGAVPLSPDMDLLDFGCGTGLVSLALLPQVRSVTGVDSSRGMLEVLEQKIRVQQVEGYRIRHVDLNAGDTLEGQYSLVLSSMTLHHVPEVPALLSEFHRVLAPGGCLCLMDLDSDGGLFHENTEGVFHNGFDREALREVVRRSGFEAIEFVTAAEVSKPDATGAMRTFPVFLMTAWKGR